MKKKFVLSNSRVNSYGFRLLTSGCDLTRFKANPVMLYNHKMGADRDKLPLGAWEGLSIEGDDVVATPDFDMEDDFAAKISRKVGKGHLRGASVGFEVVEVSTDPALMLPGQTLPTVTKWSPFEASIVDIPSNEEALCLRHNGELILLTKDTDLRTLSFFQPDTPNPDDAMKKHPIEILTLLGLAEGASDEQLYAAIKTLSAAKADAETKLAAETKRVTDETKAHIETEATRLKLDADAKTHLLSLAETSPELARKTLALMAPRQTLSGLAATAPAGRPAAAAYPDDRSTWGYEDWAKKDSKGLLFMKTNDPERFETLLAAQKTANLSKLK